MLWLSLGTLGLRAAARDIAIERENFLLCFPIEFHQREGRGHRYMADLTVTA